MRVVVREDFSKSRCDSLVTDIKMALQVLGEMDRKTMERYQDHVKNNTRSGRAGTTVHHYKHEKHSLQGKHGKSHPVC